MMDEPTPHAPAASGRCLRLRKSVTGFSNGGGEAVVLDYTTFYGPDAMQVEGTIKAIRLEWAPLLADLLVSSPRSAR